MAGIGHNSGRVDEPGRSWRTHSWRKARQALMPKLPIEVVRARVRRAKELGLPYKTYAGLRASSGDDLIGFMFSSNALGVLRRADCVAADKTRKIETLKAAKTLGLAQGQVSLDQLTPPLQMAVRAPRPLARWTDTRDALRDSRMVLICDTALEREWADAGRMAGVLPADVYFASP